MKLFKLNIFSVKNPIGIVADDFEAINIDRPIDLEFASFVAKKYKINF